VVTALIGSRGLAGGALWTQAGLGVIWLSGWWFIYSRSRNNLSRDFFAPQKVWTPPWLAQRGMPAVTVRRKFLANLFRLSLHLGGVMIGSVMA